MLQRAASNTHSWWSGSHIRTKQSKWLDQSLQDMEQKVHYVLKLIEEDGDSFAKRAEMYYKKRPELVNFVEESYRAYRALAERYDHLSTELQNANNTLATIFPEQFQMPMNEDDDLPSRGFPQVPFPQVPVADASTGPKGTKNREWKSLSSASKHLQAKISAQTETDNDTVPKTGLSKSEALVEIDKLQKDILALQTVKEFVKSSYQSGLSRYWGIENQIMEMQQRVCKLQDDFNLNKVIDDNDARTLMAEAALKSCQETLTQLQEKQEKHDQEAKKENNKIEDAREKLKSIRLELLNDQASEEDKVDDKNSDTKNANNSSTDVSDAAKEGEHNEAAKEMNKDKTEADSSGSITITGLAVKIDELVNKVISLETAVSNQAILIERLKTEADDLHAQIRALEEDKANLIDDTQNLRIMMKKMEEKLNSIQKLNRDVESESSNFQTSLAEACSSLDHLSQKLCNVKPDEDEDRPLEVAKEYAQESERYALYNPKGKHHFNAQTEGTKDIRDQDSSAMNYKGECPQASKKTIKERRDERRSIHKDVLRETNTRQETEAEKEGGFNWQQMLLSGLEDKENILLTEYTAILRNYKEAKKKLADMEKENRHNRYEVTLHVRELKNAILKRDKEIQRLHQRLNALQETMGEQKDDIDDRSIKPESKTVDIYLPSIDKEDEDIKCILIDQPKDISPVEEKFRVEIDAILDDNLAFLLRFGTSHHQIQMFKNKIKDMHDQIEKLKEKKRAEGNIKRDMISEVDPIYKNLKGMHAESTIWLERSHVLKDELDKRFSSLCNIQENITEALKEGIEDQELRFSSHQAAKFQGEILNMKQENSKVREELQTGIDHVTTLQSEINETLRKLNKEFEYSGNQSQLRHSMSLSRVTLQSFIFGTKQKKHKSSIFSRMHLSKRIRS